jgi:phosphoribosyl-ATP pyrophosphohydrolase/phosphoribosyl-AMP cyclohydrolase/histidinol dehydrogenase
MLITRNPALNTPVNFRALTTVYFPSSYGTFCPTIPQSVKGTNFSIESFVDSLTSPTVSSEENMESTDPLPLVPSVDITLGPPFQKGITRDQCSLLGCVFFTINDGKVQRLLGFLNQHVEKRGYINVAAVTSVDNIVSILNAGAHTLFVSPSQLEGLKAYGDRVALIVSDTDKDFAQIPAGGILIKCGEDLEVSKAALKSCKESKASSIYLSTTSTENMQDVVDLARENSAIVVIPAAHLTMENTSTKDLLSVPSVIAASWTSDRSDHLIPTVVTDERGIALGLVYSSQESLSESLKTGTGNLHHFPRRLEFITDHRYLGVYQSRKQGLWHKGATSGDTQELLQVSLDCDQDCLRFLVKQQGRGMSASLFFV